VKARRTSAPPTSPRPSSTAASTASCCRGVGGRVPETHRGLVGHRGSSVVTSCRGLRWLATGLALLLGTGLAGCVRPEQPQREVIQLTFPLRGQAFDYLSPDCWSYDSRIVFYTRERSPTGSVIRAARVTGQGLRIGSGHSVAAARSSLRLLFRGGDGLTICDLAGGVRCSMFVAGEYEDPTWSHDDRWIACRLGARLAVASASGGEPRIVDKGLVLDEKRARPIIWAPGAPRVAYLVSDASSKGRAAVRVYDAESNKTRSLGIARRGASLCWVTSALVAYVKPSEEARRVSDVVCQDVVSGSTASTGASVASFSELSLTGSPAARLLALEGRIAWNDAGSAEAPESAIWLLDVHEMKVSGRVEGASAAWANTRAAIAFVRAQGQPGIYLAEHPTWEPKLVARAPGAEMLVWSPDDRWIAFMRTNRAQAQAISDVYSEIWLVRIAR